MLRLLTILSLVILLAGCRIVILLPPAGGFVVVLPDEILINRDNVSGFLINVRGFDFDKTFYAIPEPGWYFSHWDHGEKNFCGGTNTPCRLRTDVLEGSEEAERILQSNEEFYLKPVFRRIVLPVTDAPYGGRCINSQLQAPGSVLETSYLERDNFSGNSFILDLRTEVAAGVDSMLGGSDSYPDGTNTRRMLVHYTNEQTGEQFHSEFLTAFRHVPNGFRIQNWAEYGRALDDQGNGTYSQLSWFMPPFVERFGLREGRSFDQSLNRKLEDFDGGVSLGTLDIDTRKLRTFVGYARVNTLSGEHNTCHFRDEIDEMADGQSRRNVRDSYYGINTGILVYQEEFSGSVTRELQEFRINANYDTSF